MAHEHHAGLNAFEDHSPMLEVKPEGEWNAALRMWKVRSPLKVLVELKKPLDIYFLAQPNELEVYCDGKKVQGLKHATNPQSVSVDLHGLPGDEHRVQFNWSSDFGPVAANAFRVTNSVVSQARK